MIEYNPVPIDTEALATAGAFVFLAAIGKYHGS